MVSVVFFIMCKSEPRGKKEFKKLGTGGQGLAQHTLRDVWSWNHFSMYLILCISEEDI